MSYQIILDQLCPHVGNVCMVRVQVCKGRLELKVEASFGTLELVVLLEPDPGRMKKY